MLSSKECISSVVFFVPYIQQSAICATSVTMRQRWQQIYSKFLQNKGIKSIAIENLLAVFSLMTMPMAHTICTQMYDNSVVYRSHAHIDQFVRQIDSNRENCIDCECGCVPFVIFTIKSCHISSNTPKWYVCVCGYLCVRRMPIAS